MSHDREAFERAARQFKDDELAVDMELSIKLHRNGALSVSGPVGDRAFCRKLLDEAWAAINRQEPTIITPGRDVDSRPKEAYPRT